MKFLKNLWQKKWFRVMCWKILSAILSWLLAWLADLKGEQFVMVVSFGTLILDQFIKIVNTKILNDLGVEKTQ